MQCPRAEGQSGTSELRHRSDYTARWAGRGRSIRWATDPICAHLEVGGRGFRGGLVTLIDFGASGSAAQSNRGLWLLPALSFLAFLSGAVRIQLQKAGEDFVADIVGPAVPKRFFPSAPFLVVDLVIE